MKSARNKRYALERVLAWGAELVVEIKKALEDKKVSLGEALGFWDNTVVLPAIIAAAKNIPEEWEEYKYDQDYEDALIEGVANALGVDVSEEVKAVVLQGIKTGVEASKFASMCADLAKKKK